VPGGSSIGGGIDISFENLNKISLSSDKKIVSFQPGHTWYDIYSALEKDNLTIIGGRVASVGVGGLTLGGGKKLHLLSRRKYELMSYSHRHLILFQHVRPCVRQRRVV
jgi:FAD/FMN-containing dehydrogenase